MPLPTVTEQPWLAEGVEKRSAVRSMFAEIAPTYDLLNSLLCFRRHVRWRQIAVDVLELSPGASALDACCGTGDFLMPLRNAVGPTGRVVGFDFCAPMLERAGRKVGHNAPLALADACQMPFKSGGFDAVTVGWGIRNVPNMDIAHAEAWRVLRSGGRFVSLDMAQPRSGLMRAVSRFVFHTLSPMLGGLFGKRKAYTYLPQSTDRFATREQIRASMERAGFADVRYRDFMFGNICMHWGRKP